VSEARSESDTTESVYDPDTPPHILKAIASALGKIFPRLEQYTPKPDTVTATGDPGGHIPITTGDSARRRKDKEKMVARSSVKAEQFQELVQSLKEELYRELFPKKDSKISRASVGFSQESIGLDSPRIERFLSPHQVLSLKAAGVKKMAFKSILKPGPSGGSPSKGRPSRGSEGCY
jgi:hypothetical protein